MVLAMKLYNSGTELRSLGYNSYNQYDAETWPSLKYFTMHILYT